MEPNETTAKPWSNRQVYGLAVICLLAGICLGYLVRAPFQSSDFSIPAAKPVVAHASDVNIPPGQLKQEANLQADSLLDQLKKSPDDPSLLAEVGKNYFQTRQFSLAAKYYEDSIRIKPDAAIFVKLGGAYHFDGNNDKAIAAWNQALRLDPNNPDALFNIGFVKWQAEGDAKAAIAAWQKLLKTNPNHPRRAQVEALLAQAKQHSEAPMARKE
jgi:cytochrome c-type biogenesis protein CcmH/NrfG